MNDEEITKTLNLVEEALDDYKKGKLTNFSCLVAIQLVVNPQPNPSPEFYRWAIDMAKKIGRNSK